MDTETGGGAEDLAAWMVRYQEADADAARALIEALSPALFRFLAGQLGDRQEAEDMLQEAWLRIHRVRHTYRAGEPVLPWVFAIVRRVRIDNYRKRRRIGKHETAVERLPEVARAGTEPAARGPGLPAMLAALPEGQREVIIMLKVEGLSLEEVARATSTTVGAVKQKAHRAYERLRALVSRPGGVGAEEGVG